MTRANRKKRRGSIMLTTAVSLFVLLGMLGLAADLGRVYVAKNEAQAFADLASVAAARHLDGTQAGVDAATAEVANSTNKWNFATQSFTSGIRSVEFAKSAAGPWLTVPTSAGGARPFKDYAFVRVTATPSVNLAFMPVLGTSYTQQVNGRAVAGVIPQSFPEGGYPPFTPFAHDSTDENFGFVVGQEYGIHWPGNINQANKACAGDRIDWPKYNFSDQVGGSERGYFKFQSAQDLREQIVDGKEPVALSVGDYINLTNGAKQAMADALTELASYDTNQMDYKPTWPSWTAGAPPYDADGGNGARLVVMPVNDYTTYIGGQVQVIGFAAFLLYPTYTVGGGNEAWCAIYMGSRTQGGGTSPFDKAGAYVVRLVE